MVEVDGAVVVVDWLVDWLAVWVVWLVDWVDDDEVVVVVLELEPLGQKVTVNGSVSGQLWVLLSSDGYR